MAVIRTFPNEIEAEMAMSALEAAGIEAVIVRDDCGGVQPALSMSAGVRIEVNDEDVEAATEVLDAPAEEPSEDFEGMPDGDIEN
jgi:hypothetical protein